MVRNSEMWGGLFWLAIGAFVAWAGKNLGHGSLHDPGSGFALIWIGLIMCGMSLSVTVQAMRKGGPSLTSLWEGTRWEKVLIVTVLLLIFGALFDNIGFIFCSIALLLVLMIFIDPVPLPTALLISIGSTFIVWAVLTEVLRIQMPAGILAGAPEDMLRVAARIMVGAVSWVFSAVFAILSTIFR